MSPSAHSKGGRIKVYRIFLAWITAFVLVTGCQGWRLPLPTASTIADSDAEPLPVAIAGPSPVAIAETGAVESGTVESGTVESGSRQSAASDILERLLISPDNMQITFRGKAGLVTQPGSFRQFSGEMRLNGSDPAQARLEVQIDMDSVKTRFGLLTRHLKSPDFFDVQAFPTSSFVSSSIEPTGSPHQYDLLGRLTIHGVTRSVRIPATIQVRPRKVLLEMEWVVRQTDYLMDRGTLHAEDEVTVAVTASLTRASADL
jgi:polyisoprenoid-binding protein YceI